MGRKSSAKKSRSQENAKRLQYSATRYRFIKRVVVTGSITLLSLAIAFFGNWYLKTTMPIKFSAQLSNNGDANFSYGTKQSDTYSPACGCMADKAERWRGITFAARHLKLTNSTNAKHSAFWIMASELGSIQWYPGLFRPQVKVLGLLVNNYIEPKLSELINGKGLGLKLVAQQEFTRDEAVALITNKPIELRLIGNYPVAAYLPVEHSTISISQPKTTFENDWNHTIIREDYNSSKNINLSNDTLSAEDIAYPMLDLIGPSVIISDDPQATFVSASQTSFPIPKSSNGWRGMYVIIVESPFSNRISIMPLGRDFTKKDQDILEEDFQEFSNPDFPPRPLGPNEILAYVGGGTIMVPTEVELRGKGSLEITIMEHISTYEYTNMRNRLIDNDIVIGRISSRAPELDNLAMDFRYPLIPPYDGFNIFGLLRALTLYVNKGNIMIGTSSIPIDAPSILELRNIKAFTPSGNVIPIPLRVNISEQSLDFSLEATSELLINSVPIGIRADQLRIVIEITSAISFLIGALSGLLTIITLIKTLKKQTI